MKQYPSILPPNWYQDFHGKADLKQSFQELSSIEHFYADALKGRICSLELKTKEAQSFFQLAEEKAGRAPESLPNLIRRFLLTTYRIDHFMLEHPVPSGVEAPSLFLPSLPEAAVKEFPEIRRSLIAKRAAEACIHLYLRNYQTAAREYEKLIEDERREAPEIVSVYYLGLAAALHNLDRLSDSLRHLENAGLGTLSGGALLRQVHLSARLAAFHAYLGHTQESREWHSFLDSLSCPRATKEVFKIRSERIIERCTAEARLVML